jgi:flagellar biogenesis protein FliO
VHHWYPVIARTRLRHFQRGWRSGGSTPLILAIFGLIHDPRLAGGISDIVSPLARYVVETLVMLTGVAALAVLRIVVGRRFGIGRPSGPLSLVGRLPLDGRRAVYLVRVGETVYVVGASENGLSKLGEIQQDGLELPKGESMPQSFQGVLARALGRSEGSQSGS